MKKLKVATGGCFSAGVHYGHLMLFRRLREIAGPDGEVEVYVNSDDSLVRLKGKSKLIFTQEERVELVRAIRYVDNVFLFRSDTPSGVILSRQPDVWVKSNGWRNAGDMDETPVVEQYGGRVEIWESPVKISTSQIMGRIKNG